MSNRQEHYPQLLPDVSWQTAIWQAFLNTENSFQGLETESEMRSDGGASISTMVSKVSQERFIFNLGILDALLDEEKLQPEHKWEGATYDADMNMGDAFKYWHLLVGLMRRAGFFASSRVPHTRI